MPKILLIDDEPNIVKLTAFHLRRRGYEVVSADNGANGLLVADRENPDLIVLDVMMPVMDGFEALRALKASSTLRGIPVIMLTCRSLDEDIAEGLVEGADVYMTKPFDMEKLLLAIARLLEAAQDAPDPGSTD